MKMVGKMQQTIRIEADLFLRIAKYAEASELTSQNELYNEILKAGIEALEEMEIDKTIEDQRKVPTIETEDEENPISHSVNETVNESKPSLKAMGLDVKNLHF